ncbi:hypothetical protein ZWY2020_015751 [Hordeum vulgare]|nr:hypothetical protein ZWY2020_015751 [Hordeum vulgare]
MAAAAPWDKEAAAWSEEAARLVWGGAVPLQVHLHDADVTALPPPPPFLTLGPRIGYFPLLVSTIKAHFSSSLPPGVDTVWFEYKGLPLKWGYPADILSPCEGEDSVKWNYNNSLKEAAFIISGNSKNVMNMSQADHLAMWESVRKGRSYIALEHALETLLPEFFSSKPAARAADPEPAATTPDSEPKDSDTSPSTHHDEKPPPASPQETDVAKKTKLKLVRCKALSSTWTYRSSGWPTT